jgi:hypothetical protein
MSRRPSAAIGAVALLLGLAACGVNDGSGWGSAERVPVPPSGVSFATAAVDAAGAVHVVWREKRDGRWSLRAIERRAGDAWSTPQTIAAERPFSIVPDRVVANERGDPAALWEYSGGRRSILVASVRPAGGEWEPEQAISRVGHGLAFGQIAIDARGAVTVIGRGLAGPGLWSVRREPGGAWSAPVRLTPEGDGVDSPDLAVASDGRMAVVALLKRPGRRAAVWAASASASGRWGPGEVVPGSDGARYPVVATSDAGFVAGWTEQRADGRRNRVMAARRSATGWSTPMALDRTSPHDLGQVELISDGDGVLAAWTRWEGRPQDRHASIRARRIGADGSEPAVTVSPLVFPRVARPGDRVSYSQPPVDVRLIAGATPTLLWSEAAGATRDAGHRLIAARRDDHGAWRLDRLGVAGLVMPMTGGDAAAVWFEGPPGGGATRIRMATFRG